ncbi:MAG TPA: GHKL domain-containing protein [Clostridiaceae bacterium]|jgi:two-component system sensor histidine kinase AgrC|nr:GHKL domain-containing protein [Clostridiaceae bacterium]
MLIQAVLICTTILFGIIAQMMLLNVNMKNLKGSERLFFVFGNLLVLAANIFLSLAIPVDLHLKLYIQVIHIPIFLIFWIVTRISAIKVVFALYTAVFMIYPANLVLTMVSNTIKWLHPAGYYLIYITVCIIVLLVINYYFRPYFRYLIENYSNISFVKLSLLPLAYYIANYWLGLYNFISVKSWEIIILRVVFFVITLIAYALIFDIAKTAREKEALQGSQMALSLMLESANQQLSALQATQRQAAVYRHDMRHHLALIGGYLDDGEAEKARKYIKLVQTDIEDITPRRYCENNVVNLILSHFELKAKNKSVLLDVDAQLPQNISIPETELCALLSNSLENAIEAAAQVAHQQFRKVKVRCHTHKNNLLIHIENSYTGKITMENGLPQNKREDHGFGTKSIAMIAEKHNGYCAFEATDEIFILRVVLPL